MEYKKSHHQFLGTKLAGFQLTDTDNRMVATRGEKRWGEKGEGNRGQIQGERRLDFEWGAHNKSI